MSHNKSQPVAPTSLINKRGSALVLGLGLLLLLALSIAWLAHAAQQPEAAIFKAQRTTNGPIIPPAEGDQCVADTAFMRTDHMDLLNHQRDETVVKGIRNQPFSLVECVNCHAQKAADGTAVRIDADGQFCQSCHQYAAVKIDCFSCHAAVPEQVSDKKTGRSAMRASDAFLGALPAASAGALASSSRLHSMQTVDLTRSYLPINSLHFAEPFGKDDEHAANN